MLIVKNNSIKETFTFITKIIYVTIKQTTTVCIPVGIYLIKKRKFLSFFHILLVDLNNLSNIRSSKPIG